MVGVNRMGYKVVSYIRVEPEEPIVFESLEEAKKEVEHITFLGGNETIGIVEEE